MTTATFGRPAVAPTAKGGYGFRTIARMEWHKLRTVRSTWWILAIFTVSLIGLAVLVLGHENYPRCPPPTGPRSTRSTTPLSAWCSSSC
jgi:hypothetical protein